MRKRGEQTGLDTLLVHALNHDNSLLVIIFFIIISGLANALNYPPEEYDRKIKTQRNRRGLAQAVDYVA